MSYIDTLSAQQKSNIAYIVDEAKKAGITNPISIAAMLAVVSKESAFVPKNENMNYSAKRLQEVFGLSAARANELAGKPEAIANAVYGGKYGNAANEGWKYRGRGYNGLTFKGNYETYKRLTGEDIVSNPESVNEPRIAAKVLNQYFIRNIDALRKNGNLAAYNAKDINDFKNLEDATLAFYHANAGPGKSVSYIKGLKQKDTLGGMTKALNRVAELYESATKGATEFVKKKPFLTIAITATLIVAVWALYKYGNLGKEVKKLI